LIFFLPVSSLSPQKDKFLAFFGYDGAPIPWKKKTLFHWIKTISGIFHFLAGWVGKKQQSLRPITTLRALNTFGAVQKTC